MDDRIGNRCECGEDSKTCNCLKVCIGCRVAIRNRKTAAMRANGWVCSRCAVKQFDAALARIKEAP